MVSWEEIKRDKEQIYVFLKHVKEDHNHLYKELIEKKVELPGGKHTTLQNIINIMDHSTFDKELAKNLVLQYMPDTNIYYEPELLKALHILLYTTPYTVIEQNTKALVLYLIHQEWPHLKNLEPVKKLELFENRFEYSGKRRSKNKRKSEHKKMKTKCFR